LGCFLDDYSIADLSSSLIDNLCPYRCCFKFRNRCNHWRIWGWCMSSDAHLSTADVQYMTDAWW